MADFKFTDDLFKAIKNEVNDVLQSEVAEEAKRVMRQHIEVDVYEPYEPSAYERTGKLLEDIESNMIEEDTLEIINVREDEQEGVRKNVAKIIEYGGEYEIRRNGKNVKLKPRVDHEWHSIGWQPRPFTENTYKDLNINNQHVEAMKEGLARRGIKVKK